MPSLLRYSSNDVHGATMRSISSGSTTVPFSKTGSTIPQNPQSSHASSPSPGSITSIMAVSTRFGYTALFPSAAALSSSLSSFTSPYMHLYMNIVCAFLYSSVSAILSQITSEKAILSASASPSLAAILATLILFFRRFLYALLTSPAIYSDPNARALSLFTKHLSTASSAELNTSASTPFDLIISAKSSA